MSRGYSTPPLSLTFSLFLTFLHYSFIYSNYPHHVNLSLPLISPSPNISFNVSIKIIPCGYNFLRSIFFDESKRGDANYPRNWASTTGAHHVLSIYISTTIPHLRNCETGFAFDEGVPFPRGSRGSNSNIFSRQTIFHAVSNALHTRLFDKEDVYRDVAIPRWKKQEKSGGKMCINDERGRGESRA